ncbi:1-phosphatidylinositol phosphodiesterase [Ceratocystis lukuohia]|uniref:1-phosphatidylinositol phosphodiesterase n=1 Tax=Ceratocystis lukuohia TaxID=2019550 RepID=A0ABR4MA83_9PEZI
MYFSLFTTLAFLAFSQAASFQGIDDYWSFDVGAGQNADWMSNLADGTLLSSLSMPGTHRSLTHDFKYSVLRTQNEDLVQQLNGGIRYIDITCDYYKHGLEVFHAKCLTSYNLFKVFGTINEFLDEHPRETVIIRMQTLIRPEEIKDSFKFFMHTRLNRDTVRRLYRKGTAGITSAPTLGEVRGKIFILQDFETSPPGLYGLPWNSDTVSSYSNTMTLSTFSLKSIWAGAQSHFSEAPLTESNKLRITYTTASYGVYPINLAARNSPRSGMNKLLGEYLSNNDGDCFGIIVMDFPGQYLVQQILKLNDKYLSLDIPGVPHDGADTSMADEAAHGTVNSDEVDSPATVEDDEASPLLLHDTSGRQSSQI